jgi:hypothetical protein
MDEHLNRLPYCPCDGKGSGEAKSLEERQDGGSQGRGEQGEGEDLD